MKKTFCKTKRKINRLRGRENKSKKGGSSSIPSNFKQDIIKKMNEISECRNKSKRKGKKRWKSTLACITGSKPYSNTNTKDSEKRVFFPEVHGWQIKTENSLTKDEKYFLPMCNDKIKYDIPTNKEQDTSKNELLKLSNGRFVPKNGYKYIGDKEGTDGNIENIRIPKSNKRRPCWKTWRNRRAHTFADNIDLGEKCVHNYQCKSGWCDHKFGGLTAGICTLNVSKNALNLKDETECTRDKQCYSNFCKSDQKSDYGGTTDKQTISGACSPLNQQALGAECRQDNHCKSKRCSNRAGIDGKCIKK